MFLRRRLHVAAATVTFLVIFAGCRSVALKAPSEALVGWWYGEQFLEGGRVPAVTGTDLRIDTVADSVIAGEWRGQHFTGELKGRELRFEVPDWRVRLTLDEPGTLTGKMLRKSREGRFHLFYLRYAKIESRP